MQEIQGLLSKLKNENWWVRKNTIEDLLSHPEDFYLATLEEWLRNDDDALLRNAAMETYRALGKKAVRPLTLLLIDATPDVRIFAANLLGDIKDASAVPQLISAMNDPDINVQIASAEAIGKIGDDKAIDTLADCIENAPWVAMAAIEAIGQIGGDKALGILYKCLEKDEYRGATFCAIEKAGGQNTIRRLTPFVDNDEFRDLALKAIVSIAERERTRPMPSYFTSMIPMLISLLKSPQPDLKKAAFIALSWSEDIKALPYFFEELANDELQEYAIKGIISLGKIAVPGLIDALKTSTSNKLVLAKILSMLGENNALLRFANDEDAEVRTEVALSIAGLNTPKARKVLLELEEDSAEEVRAAAKLSLQKLAKDIK